MLAEQLSEAIFTARNMAMLDNAARLTWRGLAEGLVDDIAAARLSTAIEARRLVLRGHRLPSPLVGEMSGRTDGSSPLEVVDPKTSGEEGSNPAGIVPPPLWGRCPTGGHLLPQGEKGGDVPPLRGRCPAGQRKGSRSLSCRSPDRARSISRRRQLAASGAVPGAIAAGFTTGEIAVLTVVARECQRRGSCAWFMDRIAAVAGVCRSTARNALRQAQALGLVTVQERRRRGWRSESNIVRVVSAAWLSWLRLGGCKKTATTNTTDFKSAEDSSGFSFCSGHSGAESLYGPHGNQHRRTSPPHHS